MPHKKNPDVFEIMRGKCNRLQGVPNEIALLVTNLPLGYHRDLQLLKDILFPATATLAERLATCESMLQHILITFGLPHLHAFYLLTATHNGQPAGVAGRAVPRGLPPRGRAGAGGNVPAHARGAPHPRREYRQSLQRPHPRQDGTRDGAVRVGRGAVGTRVRDFGNENPANFKF